MFHTLKIVPHLREANVPTVQREHRDDVSDHCGSRGTREEINVATQTTVVCQCDKVTKVTKFNYVFKSI